MEKDLLITNLMWMWKCGNWDITEEEAFGLFNDFSSKLDEKGEAVLRLTLDSKNNANKLMFVFIVDDTKNMVCRMWTTDEKMQQEEITKAVG
jgi:hypothetical protein